MDLLSLELGWEIKELRQVAEDGDRRRLIEPRIGVHGGCRTANGHHSLPPLGSSSSPLSSFVRIRSHMHQDTDRQPQP
eukprot:6743000-Pyramimonas_sp.AAC.1